MTQRKFERTPTIMAQDPGNLIWIDMEMSGLSPDNDRVLEVAIVVTDGQLNVVAEGPVQVVHQADAVFERMDSWNKATHKKSGLIDRAKAALKNEAHVEAELLAFLSQHVPSNASPMCGNSVCQDRRFLARHMPKLEEYFHYRNLDVSTLKELAKRWKPGIMSGFTKHGKHEALADIHESIEELKYYKLHLLNLND
ncbi:MAG TPA: oligoribonuclease [Burkholderiales bacterium]|nr:oligoribonuclease [Burkholderiales bacterium]